MTDIPTPEEQAKHAKQSRPTTLVYLSILPTDRPDEFCVAHVAGVRGWNQHLVLDEIRTAPLPSSEFRAEIQRLLKRWPAISEVLIPPEWAHVGDALLKEDP